MMECLDREEIDKMLVRKGIGTLAMVDGKQPYSIPISFGYDPEQMVCTIQWGKGDGSQKDQAIESNSNVCLTVYEQDIDDEEVWRSIVITGEIYEIEEENEERAYASLASNAEFPTDVGVWGVPFEDVEFRLFGLSTENCTGRKFASKYNGWG
ncbi:pyridoxamine 5'-phosphate oxidase family protein [Natrinema hispanicum]|uniref:Pyridoxamine 5'-phosphate oxidase n=2 Tax=Natrinema hispanicum TaxID=392421 RepID=A0A1G6ZKF6_9EURY|nr:pyridoxamine 5'-phosphate oxidase family protein [Natrinema hispanicum]SDE03139.1 Pyridoxamine 5'-phosphate oxidase [Natrinema hispanicum]SEU15255.1 Pyridoxamine 5'-phosphate oxidase [Natrinema hispanicum]